MTTRNKLLQATAVEVWVITLDTLVVSRGVARYFRSIRACVVIVVKCIAVYGRRDVSPVTCVPPVCDVRDVLSVVHAPSTGIS